MYCQKATGSQTLLPSQGSRRPEGKRVSSLMVWNLFSSINTHVPAHPQRVSLADQPRTQADIKHSSCPTPRPPAGTYPPAAARTAVPAQHPCSRTHEVSCVMSPAHRSDTVSRKLKPFIKNLCSVLTWERCEEAKQRALYSSVRAESSS